MPLPVLHFIGAGVGFLLHCLPIRLCYYGKRNIQLCFPELSLSERKKLFRKAMMETGKGFLEAPVFFIRNVSHLESLVKHAEGMEELQQVLAKGTGVIVLGCHMGGYYLSNAYFASHFKEKACWIYRPQKGLVEALTMHLREQFGLEFLPATQEGLLRIRRALRDGKSIGMSCDHNASGNSGLFAPLFNIQASSMTLAARLANKSKCPVFFLFMQRLAWGKGYHIHVWRVPETIASDDLLTGVSTMNAMVEKAIRYCPTQHEWLYRRFRNRPEGEPELYKPKRN